ncbi:MAG: glutathione S-transferase family protein [Hyphomicrobiaceae bacterium]|nr:glutathione S-transferase family protein [Hyphomicrobiaceae bacterium]
MLRILGRANSINVRKVLWTCGELGIPFVREDWGRGFRSTDDPEFRSVNPVGLVPAVIDGDKVLSESNTIVRYLATAYGPEAFYPREPYARAQAERWMDWANYETSISLRGAFLAGVLHEATWDNDWFIATGRKLITKEIGQLDAHLSAGGPFMCGETFTVADIPIGMVVNRWFHLTNFDKPDYPAVRAYYDLLGQRPAYREHGRNGLP